MMGFFQNIYEWPSHFRTVFSKVVARVQAASLSEHSTEWATCQFVILILVQNERKNRLFAQLKLPLNTRLDFEKFDVYATEYGNISEIWIEISEYLKKFIANSFQEVKTLNENENASIPIFGQFKTRGVEQKIELIQFIRNMLRKLWLCFSSFSSFKIACSRCILERATIERRELTANGRCHGALSIAKKKFTEHASYFISIEFLHFIHYDLSAWRLWTGMRKLHAAVESTANHAVRYIYAYFIYQSLTFCRKCQETFTEIRDVLVPMFDRLKPTELEFLAAISLAMWLMGVCTLISIWFQVISFSWNIKCIECSFYAFIAGSAQINKKIATIAENYRRRVFYELHVLYRYNRCLLYKNCYRHSEMNLNWTTLRFE